MRLCGREDKENSPSRWQHRKSHSAKRETRDRKWLDSGFFFVFAGGRWRGDGRSAWAKRRKKDGDLLTHDHGARGEKRRVVEFLDVSRPKARAVNLMSVPLRDRDGTSGWCGRQAGKSLGDSGGTVGGGVSGRGPGPVGGCCDVRRLSSRRLFPVGRASSVPAGNASMALQWQLAYSCPRRPAGWIGYDWRLSHYLDSRLVTCCCCFSCCSPSTCHSGEILQTWDAGAMRCGDGLPRVAVSGV